jgi:acetyl-CoA carboxylase biotin carboxylase subunit
MGLRLWAIPPDDRASSPCSTRPHRQPGRDRPPHHPRLPRAGRRGGLRLFAGRQGRALPPLADRAICIGPGPAKDSYLNISRIISAAEVADVDAIHPGYGFLASAPTSARSAATARSSSSAPAPRRCAGWATRSRRRTTPRPPRSRSSPGSEGAVEDEDEAVEIAEEIGYPVIIKAAAGGGGRGMRVCHNEATLRTNLLQAQQEAQAAFGDGSGLHREVPRARPPRRGAGHGRQARQRRPPLGARLLDPAPPPEAHRGGPRPGRRPKKIDGVCEAAARLVKSAEYAGAATVEFLMDDARANFYMLEVNTRVQVEHPVTEMITGVDIVQTSILVAAGEPLPFKQKDIRSTGTRSSAASTPRTPPRTSCPAPGRSRPGTCRAGPACAWTRTSSRATASRPPTTR